MSYSKLIIKNFGKIKEAEIELSNLILFIGDNNSGKSYLMTLIYGLMKYSRHIIDIIISDKEFIDSLEEYGEIKNIFEKYLKMDDIDEIESIENVFDYVSHNVKNNFNSIEKSIIYYKKDELDIFYSFLNKLLNKCKTEILKFIFNDNDNVINLESIYFDYSNYFFNIFITKENCFYFNMNRISQTFIKYGINYLFVIRSILYSILENNFYSLELKFLPTSRTGFLLTYKELSKISNMQQFSIGEKKEKTLFQKPIIDFINSLIDLSYIYEENEEFKDIIEIFENNILKGKIIINKETNAIYYQPNNRDLKVPMHLCSAVITEVAPLYLLLKYYPILRDLFIEEPELSLHLKLQKQLARVLINLVNKKRNIIVSTHSDTILEHINNMAVLHSMKDEDKKNQILKEYSYTENDTIDIDKIRIYQFDTDDNDITTVKELKGDRETGFYIETFHKYINNASIEYDAINED
ncbi:AAA family ATPase [Brachyspira hyodysenteriae]|uniref:AAA family ATPase n=1 Tax=Brachyspira hyodysenteriae TaxID=159 RepID=UPI0022CE1CE9|nr:AAA family ATPase [Brachyspira hyodysenteriae]MDA0079982.1 ATP-binding protein [Brachyspira hyodysenteriae]